MRKPRGSRLRARIARGETRLGAVARLPASRGGRKGARREVEAAWVRPRSWARSPRRTRRAPSRARVARGRASRCSRSGRLRRWRVAAAPGCGRPVRGSSVAWRFPSADEAREALPRACGHRAPDGSPDCGSRVGEGRERARRCEWAPPVRRVPAWAGAEPPRAPARRLARDSARARASLEYPAPGARGTPARGARAPSVPRRFRTARAASEAEGG
jgi:hypothetical protein